MNLEKPTHTTPQSALSHAASLSLALVISAVVLAIDLLPYRINVPILYILPLLIYARVCKRYGLLVMGGFLAVLTLGSFVYNNWANYDQLYSYRLLNRSFVAISLGTCALILQRWRIFRVSWEEQNTAGDDDTLSGRISSQTVLALKRTVVSALAVIIIIVLLLADFEAPGQINVPILYFIPLLMIGLIYPWRITVLVLIALIGLALGGFFLGRPTTVDHAWYFAVLTNRFLACGGLLLAGGMIYLIRRKNN